MARKAYAGTCRGSITEKHASMVTSNPGSVTIIWEHPRPVAEEVVVRAALTRPDVVRTALSRLYGQTAAAQNIDRYRVRHLATGGAKRVYLVQALSENHGSYTFVLKQFLTIQLAHLPPGTTVGGATPYAEDVESRLLGRMVWAAQRIDQVAPGLCPRFGGFCEWRDAYGQACRIMIEAYVAGHSLDRWKGILEDRFVQGELDFAQYSEQRLALERQAIAAYMRLWDVLGRCTFTSDPSPWNVLFTPIDHGYRPVLIDLHSIHDGGTPLYVFQTLEELFGNRDEVRQHALCPGILDALGPTDGLQLLNVVRRELEAQATVREQAGLSPFTASIRAITNFLASIPNAISEVRSTPDRP
jgi:hypothetical protein